MFSADVPEARCPGIPALSSKQLRHLAESLCHAGIQITVTVAPGPVAVRHTGNIHTAFLSQLQYILNREDGVAGDASQADADEIPADAGSVCVHVTAHLVAGIFGSAVVPAGGRIVVMGAGVADAVTGIELVGKKGAFPAVEGKLQHTHAREAKGIPELFYLGRNQAQILRENRQVLAQRVMNGTEQFFSGTFFHSPEMAFSASTGTSQ